MGTTGEILDLDRLEALAVEVARVRQILADLGYNEPGSYDASVDYHNACRALGVEATTASPPSSPASARPRPTPEPATSRWSRCRRGGWRCGRGWRESPRRWRAAPLTCRALVEGR